ncbi:MAG: hypothetical protein ACREN6_02705 [Gemmatimonadaceae bacterium]
MKTRRLIALSAVLTIVVAASCDRGSSPVSPATNVDALFVHPLGNIQLLACTPLPADSTTAAIGPRGGIISVGPHHLVVPRGALSSVVNITAIVPSDTVNRVVFLPSGLTFRWPARLEMSYANCGVLQRLLPHRIAYIDDAFNILDLLPSLDNLLRQRVSARIHHFSDYAVAW